MSKARIIKKLQAKSTSEHAVMLGGTALEERHRKETRAIALETLAKHHFQSAQSDDIAFALMLCYVAGIMAGREPTGIDCLCRHSEMHHDGTKHRNRCTAPACPCRRYQRNSHVDPAWVDAVAAMDLYRAAKIALGEWGPWGTSGRPPWGSAQDRLRDAVRKVEAITKGRSPRG